MSLSGEAVPPLFFSLSEGDEKEKVKLADAEFLFQDKWRGLLSWVYLATIDLVS